jgi:signal transduction histidine kinase
MDDLVTFQTRHQRKDGTFYLIEARVQLSHAEVYPVFVAVLQDITEKKKAEEELAVHRHHLEELVLQRTADLESTHLQLLHAEKLSATGKMAASMAHEFNNPIFGIRNILEKIMRRVQMEDNNKRFVKLAIQECDRVTLLIRKVLDFHSPSTDEKEWIDVHESIDDMTLLIQKRFSVRDIRLIKEYAADMPNIEVVPDQFMQVILNILQNADEAIPEGGGRITISTSATNGEVQIQIQDTGVGIPTRIMKNIFDPFFTTKPSVKGTGLGLSVTYGIIKKHGGEVLVDSQPGRGTTFTILLPVKQGNTATLPG